MSLTSALDSAISGLQAQSAAISAVSENIANASTTAYKTTDINFQSLVDGNTTSAGYSSGGVTFKPLQNVSQQGLVEATSTATNVAINGNGFFVVSDATNNQPSDFTYSRNGSFTTDANGYLVNSEGSYLMGWKTDAAGNVTATDSTDLSSLSPVSTNTISGSAKATSTITIAANLPADAVVNTSTTSTPTTNSSFTTSSEIFDSLGVAQTVDETWTKTGSNSWQLTLANPTLTSDNSTTSGTISPATINLTFNGDGSIATASTVDASNNVTSVDPSNITLGITGFTTGASDSAITLNLGSANGTNGLTQYSSSSTTPAVEDFTSNQDGVRYGKLSSISIDNSGIVIAKFDNGLTQDIYKIPVATFANPDGLTHVSGTVYDDNSAAGNYSLSSSGSGAAGNIESSSLEESATDTSAEFDKMIVAQQAYSAAAQVVSTTGNMFTTLIRAVQSA